MPLIDPDTKKGFLINFQFQSFLGVLASIAFIGTEAMVAIGDATIYSMKEIIKFRLREFNKIILNGNGLNHLEDELQNILKSLDDMRDYIAAFNKMLYYKSFIQPTFTKFGAALGIVCQYLVMTIRNSAWKL